MHNVVDIGKGVMGSRDYILIIVLYWTLLLGVLFLTASQLLAPTIKYFMMLLLFLSFIKIAPGDAWHSIRSSTKAIILGGVVRLVLAPFFVSLCKGNISFTLVMVIATSLLVPFSLPLIVKIVHGRGLDYDLLSMGLFLAMIIFIPLVSSFVLRRIAPRLLDHLNGVTYPLSLVVIATVMGRYVPYLWANFDQLIIAGNNKSIE